jgi:hypothetical protein
MGDDTLAVFSESARQKKDTTGLKREDEGMKTKPENPLPKTLPGAVCAQMVRCGKPSCKCARGELHGPYYYHFTRQRGVLVKRYVRASEVVQVRAACESRRKEEKQRRTSAQISNRQLATLIGRLRQYAALIEGIKR